MYKQILSLCLLSFMFFGSAEAILSDHSTTTIDKIHWEEFRQIVKQYAERIKEEPDNVKLITAVAEVYYSMRDYPRAIAWFSKALVLAPDDQQIELMLAKSYLNGRDYSNSRRLFEKLNKEKPNQPEILGGLGRLETKNLNFEAADRYFEKALEIDPANSTTRYYLALLRARQKRYDEAEAMLKSLIEEEPKATWIYRSLEEVLQGPAIDEVKQLESVGNYDAAERLLKALLASDPENMDVYYELSQVYVRSGRIQPALKLLKQGLRREPGDPQLYLGLGYVYVAQGDYQKAEKLFNRLIANGFQTADVVSGLGRIAALRGDKDLAEQYYLRALSLSPKNPLVLAFLADLRLKEKRYEDAIRLYEQIYQGDTNAIWTLQAIEEAELLPVFEQIKKNEMQGKFEEVERLYLETLDRLPQNSELYLRLGHFYIEQKRHQDAIAVYRRLIDQGIAIEQAEIGIGNAYLLSGAYVQAFDTFYEVLAGDPINADALAGMGRTLQSIGDVADAENDYRMALSHDSRNTTALAYYADLMLQQKDYARAGELFTELEQLLPHETWVRQSLRRAQFGPMLEEIYALEKAGNDERALALYRMMLEAEPDTVEAYMGIGRIYMSQKKYHQAVSIYERGLQYDPSSSSLKTSLGFAYLLNKSFKEAGRLFHSALIGNPSDAEAVAGLARIAELQKDPKSALALYAKAIQLGQEDTLVLSYYARFLLSQRKYNEAQEVYETLRKLNPEQIWIVKSLENVRTLPILEMVEAKETSKSYQEAEAILRHLVEEDPHRADNYLVLGGFYERRHKVQEAIQVYLSGLKLIPESVLLQDALGYAYLKAGKADEAKGAFEQVLQMHPDDVDALAGLGKVAEEKGDNAAAEGAYKDILEKDPQNINALTLLAGLMAKEGEDAQAYKLYKKIHRLQPEAKWVKQSLLDAKNGEIIREIKTSIDANEFERASKLYDKLIARSPSAVDYYLRAGLYYNYNKKYDKAIDTYQQGIEIVPTSPELYAALGLSYLSKKSFKDALKAFDHSLDLDPANADSLAGLGSIALADKKLNQAEVYINASQAIDPDNIAGLSSLGNLRMAQKRYSDAQAAYAKLMELRPKDKWIKREYENAVNGAELDTIDQLIKNEQLSEAAEKYARLLSTYPENSTYAFGLGQMYLRLRMYSKAIEVFTRGLEVHPEETELLVSLGYSYLFSKKLSAANQAFSEAYDRDPKNAELLAGIGQINFLEKMSEEAEMFFRRALAISPINFSALNFYSALLLEQSRYDDALDILLRLKQLLPNADWVAHAINDAEDGPLMDYARCLANNQYFECAAAVYRWLVAASPNDPARYQPLGQAYVDMNQYERGICIFRRGLEIDPDAKYLWRSIAFALIEMNDYCNSWCIFMSLLGEDNEDAESWAGLGRIETLNGSFCRAEEYFAIALDLSPENVTVLSYTADLERDELYYFSGLQLYAKLMEIDCRPKWVRTGYRSFLDLTCPTIHFTGAYHQEIQWDPLRDRWSAQYEVYGIGALVNYPVCDELSLFAQAADQFYILNDLLGDFTIYSFDVQRVYLGGRWVVNPCFYIDAKAGVSNFSPYSRCTSFNMMSGVIGEPTLTFTYHAPTRNASLSFASDADLIARDFNSNLAKLVARYYIAGQYGQEVIKRGWFNVEGDMYWYRDFVANTSQRVAYSFQWRPPKYYDYVLLSYFGKYQRFDKNIPDYYTYKYQFINQLQIKLERDWRVCWADYFYTSMSYGHGWQDTRTRFPQIIVITPPGVLPPFVWDRRQYNILNGTAIYRRDQLQITLTADYYHDTEKYTMWSLGADIRWRF